MCQSFFFNKIAGLRSEILLKKRLYKICFPVTFCEIFKDIGLYRITPVAAFVDNK